ncbi:hypothetical protein COE14_28040 [Bacillus thuringiensis]|nr:hypothetical protein COE14_28040 [Bacillus thuringiensis]
MNLWNISGVLPVEQTESRVTLKQMEILEKAYHRQREGDRLEDIAKSFGISRKTLYMWRQKPAWKSREKEIHKELMGDAYHEILEVVKAKALKGSVAHARLFMDEIAKTKKYEEDSAKKLDVSNGITDDVLADIDELLGGN